jgi:hypothetical protein
MGVIYLQIGQRMMKTYQAPKKTKHPEKGERKVQDGWTQGMSNRRNHQSGRVARGT